MTEPFDRKEVVEVVRNRLRTGRRDDGARLGLVIEGGGMRGIVSAAMTCVLEEAGILDVVDLIVGTSSGGVNAAAAAAGVIEPMTRSYVEIFSSRKFVDPRRLISRQAVVDSPAIVAHIDRLFDIGSLLNDQRAPRLAVVATDIVSAQAEALTDFTDRHDLLSAIHASGLLPLLGGAPIELRGRRWLDGGVIEPVPVLAAHGLGATHLLVLGTRQAGTGPRSGPADRIIERHLHALNPQLVREYRARRPRYLHLTAAAERGQVAGLPALLLQPDVGSIQPSRLDRSPSRLSAALEAARVSARQQLAAMDLMTTTKGRD